MCVSFFFFFFGLAFFVWLLNNIFFFIIIYQRSKCDLCTLRKTRPFTHIAYPIIQIKAYACSVSTRVLGRVLTRCVGIVLPLYFYRRNFFFQKPLWLISDVKKKLINLICKCTHTGGRGWIGVQNVRTIFKPSNAKILYFFSLYNGVMLLLPFAMKRCNYNIINLHLRC